MGVLFILSICLCAWSVSPADAQTFRDGVSSAAGEPTDPEENRLQQGATSAGSADSPVRPTSGTQNPVLTPHPFSDRLEAFLNLLRRFGIFIPTGYRP
jgi:hypothetical protein